MTDQLPARTEDVPASLIDVAETLGMGVVWKVMQAFGGQEVLFPINPREGHVILRELGDVDGRAICALIGGATVYIPHGRPARSVRREVIELRRLGASPREIVRRLGISQRHVRRLANEAPKDVRQLSLFDED